jgi:hypothetical protein
MYDEIKKSIIEMLKNDKDFVIMGISFNNYKADELTVELGFKIKKEHIGESNDKK